MASAREVIPKDRHTRTASRAFILLHSADLIVHSFPAHATVTLPVSHKVDLAELQGQMADEWLREREANRKLLGTVFMVRGATCTFFGSRLQK